VTNIETDTATDLLRSYADRGMVLQTCCKPNPKAADEGQPACLTRGHNRKGERCSKPGKIPDNPWKQNRDGSWNETVIKKYDPRFHNIGAVTSEEGGFCMLDVDGDEGRRSLAQLVSKHGRLPITAQSTSGRGEHHWFKIPEGTKLTNRVGFLPGLDFRGAGGFGVLPPSVHISGRQYQWGDGRSPGEVDFAGLPHWLVEVVNVDRTPRPVPNQKGVVVASTDEVQRYVQRARESELKRLESAPPGTRNDQLNKSAFALGQLAEHFDNPEQVRADLLDVAGRIGLLEDDGDHQCMKTVMSGWLGGERNPRDLSHVGAMGREHFEWMESLKRLKGGEIRHTDTNAILILSNAAEWEGILGFNTRLGQPVFRHRPPVPDGVPFPRASYPKPITNVDISIVVAALEQTWNITLSTHAANNAVEAAAHQSPFDPVVEYLEDLKWDQRPRLSTWLPIYCGVPGDNYSEAVGSKWMISAVARAYDPGCKVDHCLVLEGDQGIGKSSILRALASEEFFLDNTPRISKRKEVAEAIRGKWIVEFAELDSFSKTENTEVKSFLSGQDDTFRGAYKMRAERYPRQCVFAATTNETHYLMDDTGARRFWPVRCAHADVKGLVKDRDQLWAEAVHRFRAGETWHLTAADIPAAQRAQEERAALDPWIDLLGGFVEGKSHVLATDLLRDERALNLPSSNMGKHTYQRLGRVMSQLGWVKRNTKGRNRRVTFEPQKTTTKAEREIGQ